MHRFVCTSTAWIRHRQDNNIGPCESSCPSGSRLTFRHDYAWPPGMNSPTMGLSTPLLQLHMSLPSPHEVGDGSITPSDVAGIRICPLQPPIFVPHLSSPFHICEYHHPRGYKRPSQPPPRWQIPIPSPPRHVHENIITLPVTPVRGSPSQPLSDLVYSPISTCHFRSGCCPLGTTGAKRTKIATAD